MQIQRLVWVVGVVAISLTSWGPARAAQDEEYYDLMKVFVDSFEQIERNYVQEVDKRELVEAALRGMMEKLDPYSNFISPQELSRFNAQVEQEFGGIGIQVTLDEKTHRLTVMTPLPGTPAYRKGIRAGDQILEIDGKTTEGFMLDDAVRLLKGKPGESVTIGVLHPGGTSVEQIAIEREIIHVATVLGESYNSDNSWNFMLDHEKKIGYIRLTAFSRNSTRELQTALKTLQSEGMKALILDLRFNPGGLLSTATEVSDLFIEEGKIVSTKGRNTEERVWNAQKANTFAGFPMVVLVNRYSASASEIVSACLQDHKRAVIVGERTWGKGSVQNVIELENGKSALKLTTASYHRPSGKNIHRFPGAKDSDEWGVMPDPDFIVNFTREDMEQYLDSRKQRDVLNREAPAKSEFIDRQLEKGLEYLNSQLSGKSDSPAAAGTDKKATEEKKPEEKKADDEKPNADKKASPQQPEQSKKPETADKDKSGAGLREDEIRIQFLKSHPARAT